MLLLLFNASPAGVLVPSRQRLGPASARAVPSAPAKAVARAAAFVAAVSAARRPVVSVTRTKSANRAGLRNTRKPIP